VRRGESLVGVLVAVAIVILLAVAFSVGSGVFGGPGGATRADGKGETIVGRSKFAAKDVECRNNLSQLRTAIRIATDPVEDTKPTTLQETRLGSDFYRCPVGKEDYVYDSESGKVSCPHKGHENY
jgi:hypothetical protein